MSTATGNHSIQYIIREFVNPTQTDNFDKYNEYFCPKNMGNKITYVSQVSLLSDLDEQHAKLPEDLAQKEILEKYDNANSKKRKCFPKKILLPDKPNSNFHINPKDIEQFSLNANSKAEKPLDKEPTHKITHNKPITNGKPRNKISSFERKNMDEPEAKSPWRLNPIEQNSYNNYNIIAAKKLSLNGGTSEECKDDQSHNSIPSIELNESCGENALSKCRLNGHGKMLRNRNKPTRLEFENLKPTSNSSEMSLENDTSRQLNEFNAFNFLSTRDDCSNINLNSSLSKANRKSTAGTVKKDVRKSKSKSSDSRRNYHVKSCYLCQWVYPIGMTQADKNTHLNYCIEGNGEMHIMSYLQGQNSKNKRVCVKVCPFCGDQIPIRKSKKHINDCMRFLDRDQYTSRKRHRNHIKT